MAISSEPKAILAINTFRKDATDPNPLIRSLAVRTMGCIRLDQVTAPWMEVTRCSQEGRRWYTNIQCTYI
jgi:vesicle coat complex subunit